MHILQNFHSVYGYFNCHPWYNEGNLCPDQEQIYQNSKTNATLRALYNDHTLQAILKS